MTDPDRVKRCPCPEHEGPNPLPVSEFHKDSRRPGGLSSWCRTCSNRARKGNSTRLARANPEKHRQQGRRYRAANPEKVREYRQRYSATARENWRRWWQADPGKERARRRRRRKNLRDQVLGHYGRICACPGCGATERLSIDHVNGDGKAHSIELFGTPNVGNRLYLWLIKQGFPEGIIQILCGPCNSSKGSGPACRLDHFGEETRT